VAATHGVFSADASRVLRGAELDGLFLLDTIAPPRLDADLLQTKVQMIDCTPLLAAAIHRLHTDGSLVALSEA